MQNGDCRRLTKTWVGRWRRVPSTFTSFAFSFAFAFAFAFAFLSFLSGFFARFTFTALLTALPFLATRRISFAVFHAHTHVHLVVDILKEQLSLSSRGVLRRFFRACITRGHQQCQQKHGNFPRTIHIACCFNYFVVWFQINGVFECLRLQMKSCVGIVAILTKVFLWSSGVKK